MSGAEIVQLGIAGIGAVGTILSAWILARVHRVEATVNGHTAKLESELERVRNSLDTAIRRAPAEGRALDEPGG